MDPDKAYRDTHLWIPKMFYGESARRGILRSLTLQPRDGKGTELQLWKETETHLGLPRALQFTLLPGLELVDAAPQHHDPVHYNSRIRLDLQHPDLTVQHDAVQRVVESEGGILHISCGWGKTVIMLEGIARLGVPALIINNREHILHQWKEEIEEHLGIETESIGWVQGPPKKWRWRPVTLAMLNTLALHRDSIQEWHRHYYGVVVWDECSHLGASMFSRTCDLFTGRRFGITATVDRPDGLELVYLWHLGPILYQYLDQELQPRACFVQSPTTVDLSDSEVRREVTDCTHEVHHARLCAHVGCQPGELELTRRLVNRAVAVGRDILAITVSKEHARALHAMYPDTSAILDGDVKPAQRLLDLRKHRLAFATVETTYEALNKKSLDTLFILTEFSATARLTQAVGRILRYHPGKRTPMVVVLDHHRIPDLKRGGDRIKALFRKWDLEVQVVRERIGR